MTRAKKLTKKQFNMRLIVSILLVIGLIYFMAVQDIYGVSEDGLFVEHSIISPKHPINYNTEFCAGKLSDLAHEIHFLEEDIGEQEDILRKFGKQIHEELNVIQLEQREKEAIREEFDEYRLLCDQFDKKPTPELCNRFLNESAQHLEVTIESLKALQSRDLLDELELVFHDSRKAIRIYKNLRAVCAD
ncbi:MAG: hypothetical protein ACE5FT_07880, partial [Candidatus Nanoarchaeia archaeon]